MCLNKIKTLQGVVRNLRLLFWDVTADLRLCQFHKTEKAPIFQIYGALTLAVCLKRQHIPCHSQQL